MPEDRVSILIDSSNLQWFKDSPDAGDPNCICSLCGKVISIEEVPIRMWKEPLLIEEIRLHWDCFLKVQK